MRQHSGRQMYTHTTKEEQTILIKHSSQPHKQPKRQKKERECQNSQEWNPSQILKHGCEEIPLSQPDLQKRITQIPNTRKNNSTSKENLETM
jgi:hypothetical protein